jgi:hypothetical protein
MTQEEKDILIKDLSARLPYGVMLETDNVFPQKLEGIAFDKDTFLISVSDGAFTLDWMTFRPYLYPLSSMTEKQYDEFIRISGWNIDIETVRQGKFSCIGYIGLDCLYDAVDWFNKNHLDYRGLIPMNLAIDATGLNIY